MQERTFGMIEPVAVEGGKANAILGHIEKWGLKVVGFHQRLLQDFEVRWLYLQHRRKTFFRPLITFSTSAPALLMALEGESAVETFRLMVLHCLRPKYGIDFRGNAIHASDSPFQASRELYMFFPEFAMSVDGFIFDKISLECLYFDRLSNLNAFRFDPAGVLQGIFSRLKQSAERKAPATVTSAEVARLMEASMAAWEADEGRTNHWYWCAKVHNFASRRPNGAFFVVTDHDEPDSWDVRYQGRYLMVDDPL